jgi:hypothetical protein
MPISQTSERHHQLRELVCGLAEGELSCSLRQDDRYPKYLVVVSASDEYELDLFRRGFGAENSGDIADNDAPQLIRAEGSVENGSALYRYSDEVVVWRKTRR